MDKNMDKNMVNRKKTLREVSLCENKDTSTDLVENRDKIKPVDMVLNAIALNFLDLDAKYNFTGCPCGRNL